MRELTAVSQPGRRPGPLRRGADGRVDNFCLGMDFKDEEVAKSATAGLAERRVALKTGPRMCRAWEELDPLTIVAIEGWCVGGGVALAVSCDLRIIGTGGHFYVPEVERGFNMSWGSVPRITNLVGPARPSASFCWPKSSMPPVRRLWFGRRGGARQHDDGGCPGDGKPRRLAAAQRGSPVQKCDQRSRQRPKRRRQPC